MVMPKSYDLLVEKLMHKVTQMTEQETAEEIAKTTEGVFAPQTNASNNLPDVPLSCPSVFSVNPPTEQNAVSGGYMTTTGRLLKGKPGRKKGWRKVKA